MPLACLHYLISDLWSTKEVVPWRTSVADETRRVWRVVGLLANCNMSWNALCGHLSLHMVISGFLAKKHTPKTMKKWRVLTQRCQAASTWCYKYVTCSVMKMKYTRQFCWWPFWDVENVTRTQRRSLLDLQIVDKKVTLNHLTCILQTCFLGFWGWRKST